VTEAGATVNPTRVRVWAIPSVAGRNPLLQDEVDCRGVGRDGLRPRRPL